MNDFREYQAAFSDHQDDLMHYASKYYDPVKAHEYYMKHRKLKGGNHYKRLSFLSALNPIDRKDNRISGGINSNSGKSASNTSRPNKRVIMNPSSKSSNKKVYMNSNSGTFTNEQNEKEKRIKRNKKYRYKKKDSTK